MVNSINSRTEQTALPLTIDKEDSFTLKILSKLERNWTPKQQTILKGRMNEIVGYAKQNIGENATEDELIKEINEMIVSVGSPLNIEEPKNISPECQSIFRLFFKEAPEFTTLLSQTELLKSIFIKKNEPLFKEFRGIIQSLLEEIYNQVDLEEQVVDPSVDALINHILSHYALFSPQEGKELRVPIYDNGMWELVNYQVGFIPQTPSWLGTTHNALTLTPKKAYKPPIIVSKATSYPSEDGFLMTVLSDFNPFGSVGKYAFTYSKDRIEEWLKKVTEEKHHKARYTGESLGGALGQHNGVNFQELLERGNVYCPPALWPNDMDPSKEVQNMKIFKQHGGDPVPEAGFQWPKGAELYVILGAKERTVGVTTHVRCHSADETNIILKLNPEKDVNRVARKVFALFHAIISIPVFIIACLLLLISISVQGAAHLIKKMKGDEPQFSSP